MSKKTTYLLGILFTIVLGSWLYYMLCCKNCDADYNSKNAKQSVDDKSLSLKKSKFSIEGSDFKYSCSDNFNFSNSGFEPIMPISDSISLGIELLKSKMTATNSEIKITGYALATEKNNSIFPTLGLARANAVKNYFVSKGIPEKNIEISGEMIDNLNVSNNTVFGPVSFGFSQKVTSNEPVNDSKVWGKLREEINANPLTIYFKTGESEIKLSDEDKQKVAKIVDYLNHVDNSTINAVGHSDNVGKRDSNIALSLERANFVKDYLIKNGILATKITTTSKGPDEPIANNSTSEGRAKNRRTTLLLN